MDFHGNNRPNNQTFGSSPEKSPLHPGDTLTTAAGNTNTKRGFLNIFGGKKKDINDPQSPAKSPVKSPAKGAEAPANNAAAAGKASKPRGRMVVNKKNISDGRIRLNIIDNDRVPEDFQIEYRDNPFEMLDHNPVRTTSYIENIKNRDFSLINNREVKRFFENQQTTKDIVPPAAVNNLELDLLDVQDSYEKIFGKFYRFFQGLLPGFLAIHIFLVYGGSDSYVTIMSAYMMNCLRINQVFYAVTLISALGALHRYIETKLKYMDAQHTSPLIKDSLGKQIWKYLIASICYSCTYYMMIYCHIFASKLSNTSSTDEESALSDDFGIYRILYVVMAALTIIGWFSLSLSFDEIGTMHSEMTHNNDLTGEGDDLESP